MSHLTFVRSAINIYFTADLVPANLMHCINVFLCIM